MLLNNNQRPTKRAPDAGDSAHIPNSFTRLSIFPVGRLRRPRPSAGNANRWAFLLQNTFRIEKIMIENPDVQFLHSIREVFGSVFNDYEFELQNEAVWDGHGEYTVTASKGEIELKFYLGLARPIYLCDLWVKLSGTLAYKATPDKHRHNICVASIASYLDSDYKRPRQEIKNEKDLASELEREKEDLLKYCKDILLGDVAVWSDVVNYLAKESRKSGL